jgi:hypothetical protein
MLRRRLYGFASRRHAARWETRRDDKPEKEDPAHRAGPSQTTFKGSDGILAVALLPAMLATLATLPALLAGLLVLLTWFLAAALLLAGLLLPALLVLVRILRILAHHILHAPAPPR